MAYKSQSTASSDGTIIQSGEAVASVNFNRPILQLFANTDFLNSQDAGMFSTAVQNLTAEYPGGLLLLDVQNYMTLGATTTITQMSSAALYNGYLYTISSASLAVSAGPYLSISFAAPSGSLPNGSPIILSATWQMSSSIPASGAVMYIGKIKSVGGVYSFEYNADVSYPTNPGRMDSFNRFLPYMMPLAEHYDNWVDKQALSPLNFRIYTVIPFSQMPVDKSMQSAVVVDGMTAPAVYVRFKWGYDYVTGTYSGSTFTVSSYYGVNLVGYYLTLSGQQVAYQIVSGVLNGDGTYTLTLSDENGNPVSLPSGSALSSAPAMIHAGADSYTVMATPVATMTDASNQATLPAISPISVTVKGGSPVAQDAALLLPVGVYFNVSITASRGPNVSSAVSLPSGTYSVYYNGAYSGEVNYSNPYLVTVPNLSNSGVSLGLSATPNGFSATVNGWTGAEMFHFIWTTNNAGASFSLLNTSNYVWQEAITTSRTIDVTTSTSANYSVSVRPLISGQDVSGGTYPSAKILSGSSGVPPTDTVIYSSYVELTTYAGSASSFTYLNGQAWQVNGVSGLVSPAASGSTASLSSAVVNSVYTDAAGLDYTIVSWTGTNMILLNYGGYGATAPTAGNFTINTSANGRLLTILRNFPTQIQCTSIQMDVDILQGDTQAVFRIYQQNHSTDDMDSLLVTSTESFNTPSDVALLRSNGALNLCVDAYDPNNLYSFTVSGISLTPISGAVYTNNNQTFTIVSVSTVGGSGTIVANGTGAPLSNGTLTKSSGTGDSTISFSAYANGGHNNATVFGQLTVYGHNIY